MNQLSTLAVVLFTLLVSTPALAEVRVVTTLADLAWVAAEVGGDHVQVRSLCAPHEDPHYVTPTPSLVAAVGDADLFVEIGLNLEIWTERLLDGAGNPKVRPGGAGYVLASAGVATKGRPSTLSRSQGDLHPDGNPHIWLDPLNMKVIVRNVAAGLARVDAPHAGEYRERADALNARIDTALYGDELIGLLGSALLDRLVRGGQLQEYLGRELGGAPLRDRLGGWLGRAQAMQGRSVVYYHQSWVYFTDRFGLTVAAYVESKPGIQPSAGHRRQVVEIAKLERVPVVLVTNYYDDRLARRIASDAGIEVAIVPIMTGGTKDAATWFDLMDTLVDAHARAFEAKKP
jgi:zinc/manganese transport system substrate-binding protein